MTVHGETAVLVLAAGAGTRMRSDTPKVLHTLAGRSMLSHSLHAVAKVAPRAPGGGGRHATASASHRRSPSWPTSSGPPDRDRRAGAAAGHRARGAVRAVGAARRLRRHRRRHLRRRPAAGRRHPGRPDRHPQRRTGRGDGADHHAGRSHRLRPHPAHPGPRGDRRSSSRPTRRRRSRPSARSTPASTPSTSPRCARR